MSNSCYCGSGPKPAGGVLVERLRIGRLVYLAEYKRPIDHFLKPRNLDIACNVSTTGGGVTLALNEFITNALKQPGGARFYKAALQVNPFEYLGRHNKPTTFTDEESYNSAIVEACQINGIEVIAITDHYRSRTGEGLRKAATEAGIRVFPGFEAATKDGVHILCLFPPETDLASLERYIGDCGIHNDDEESPLGQYDVTDFLERSHSWGAICIAAHVDSSKGLLYTLSGTAAVNAWRCPHLLACSLPGSLDEADEKYQQIIGNKAPSYRRDRLVTVINAADIADPSDLSTPGATTLIKMSDVSIEGLRQAFLDPESRIRIVGDPLPEHHSEFLAMVWEGGFLDGVSIHFNENLNVLVGGRGTGKSTIIESIRYVLDIPPLGDESKKVQVGIINNVLKSGSKISLLIRSHYPSVKDYVVERTVPNPPVVLDDQGNVLDLLPKDVLFDIEVAGQHEISELTRNPDKLTHLLDRFVKHDSELTRKKRELKADLERSRTKIIELEKEQEQVSERLDELPGLEEILKRYQEAGLEEKLKDQSLIVREQSILDTVHSRANSYNSVVEQLRAGLPIDREFLGSSNLEDLPGRELLERAGAVLNTLSDELAKVLTQAEALLSQSNDELGVIQTDWNLRKDAVQGSYDQILRDLQKDNVDGDEFIRLTKAIEDLRPIKERGGTLKGQQVTEAANRRDLLVVWEDLKAREFRELQTAARGVNKSLSGQIRSTVNFAGNRDPLYRLLRSDVGGRIGPTINALKICDTFSIKEFSDSCREGVSALVEKYGMTAAQAAPLCALPLDWLMKVEALELLSATRIALNVAPEYQPADWHDLDDLSTGQKATAVLLLLLLESDGPLIVDQPEDDLDNRFISEGVVPRMKIEKTRRQFIFATHNANIPVLGDAELILGLSATGEAGDGHVIIPPEHMASIDSQPVRELVEEVLEGGKFAFETRRLKYGF